MIRRNKAIDANHRSVPNRTNHIVKGLSQGHLNSF
jgi:hypothetical protein